MSKGRGRPAKNNNSIRVNELLVEYLSTKEDNYKNEISYFKVIDNNLKTKLKLILNLTDETMKVPLWKTDKNEFILKVKEKFVNSIKELNKKENYIIDVEFEMYEMEKDNGLMLRGYYSKIPKIHDKEN